MSKTSEFLATQVVTNLDTIFETARPKDAASCFDIRPQPDSAVKLVIWLALITAAHGIGVFEERFDFRLAPPAR